MCFVSIMAILPQVKANVKLEKWMLFLTLLSYCEMSCSPLPIRSFQIAESTLISVVS